MTAVQTQPGIPSSAIVEQVRAHVAELRDKQGELVSISEVMVILEAAMSALTGAIDVDAVNVHKELDGLITRIDQLRADVAQIGKSATQPDYISNASDELDAVVDSTEGATNAIMDAAERIEACLSGDWSDPQSVRDAISAEVGKIFESCSFQDITGQRVNKVVGVLKDIEGTIGSLTKGFQPAMRDPSESSLLNGPALPNDAKNQTEIDALFCGPE